MVISALLKVRAIPMMLLIAPYNISCFKNRRYPVTKRTIPRYRMTTVSASLSNGKNFKGSPL